MSRSFLLAWALVLLICHSAGAQVRIGELTLSYDSGRWDVAAMPDGATITCVDEACQAAAFRVTATAEPGRFCGKDEARETAQALFPFADRHATNIHDVGDLAVVMTTSSNDLGLDAPHAAFACITRDGVIHRIASMIGDAPLPAYTGGNLLDLLRGLAAPPPRLVAVELGAISIRYASDRWMRVAGAIGAAPGATVLKCLPPTCRDFGPAVFLSARESGADCAAELVSAHEQDWLSVGEPWTVVAGELVFAAAQFGTGCRNWTPPRYRACMSLGGFDHVIETPEQFGCSSAPEVPFEGFTELVASALARK
jgi:hypothetical protein